MSCRTYYSRLSALIGHRRGFVTILLASLIALSSSAMSTAVASNGGSAAQLAIPGEWSGEFGPVAGMNATVWCLTEYAGGLVAGGEFTQADGEPLSHVAFWNGTSWSPLGAGLEGTVFALAVFGGELVAGGTFYQSGNTPLNYIARWDGTAWRALGTGLSGSVRALGVLDGSLYVGGDFSAAGGISAQSMARWDGSAWHAMGNGLSGGQSGFGVRALTVSGNTLIAGGFFTQSGATPVNRVAAWSGVAWTPVGNWTNDTVYSLVDFEGSLIAGSVVWQQDLGTWVNMIARLDNGAWTPLGTGSLLPPFSNAVRALTTFNGNLIASGLFPLAGGTAVSHIARWDGQAWIALGSGTNDNVVALAVHDGKLYAGGIFDQAGGIDVGHLASWDGVNWDDVGAITSGQPLNAPAWALSVYGGQLVAGGDFTKAGHTFAQHVALWDGASWHQLGAGLEGTVFALTVFNGDLIAAGNFYQSGSTAVPNIARWDGTAWRPLGLGVDGSVRAMVVSNGSLYVGGDFYYAGNVPAMNIARWDGSTWSGVGAGLGGSPNGLGVRALTLSGGQVIAGGFFVTSGSTLVNHVARLNGASWQAIGTWSDDAVYSLSSYGINLVAGSVVWVAGSGTWVNMMRLWSGAAWVPLGAGVLAPPFSNAVRAMAFYNDNLIASGVFPLAGGTAVGNIGRWDGQSWSPLGSGINDNAVAMTVVDDKLYVGGLFTRAGGRPSMYVARWTDNDGPVPVEVEDLKAVSTSGLVRLSWKLSDDATRLVGGVSVQRAESAEGPFTERTTSRLAPRRDMAFEDTSVAAGVDYWYRLVLALEAGGDVASGTVLVRAAVSSPRTALSTPREAGSGGQVELHFSIGSQHGLASLQIYDVRGNRLRTLVQSTLQPGEYSQTWDRRSDSGQHVGRGLYLARLRTGPASVTRKFVLLHH